MSNPKEIPAISMDRILSVRSLALRIALGGLVGSLILMFWEGSGQLLKSYLASYVYVFGFGLGSLVLFMIQNITGGSWGYAIRRILEGASATLPVLAVLFLPILLGFTSFPQMIAEKPLISAPDESQKDQVGLYQWQSLDNFHEEHEKHTIEFKSVYLNPGFWVIRSVLAFGIWIGLAQILLSLSKKEDSEADPKVRAAIRERMLSISAPGILLFAITILFISTDWVSSIEPLWSSTMYPVIFGFSELLTSMAFSIIVLVHLYDVKPIEKVVGRNYLRDLGSIMLGFVIFWTYISFSQFLLIWSANLKEEVPYYINRTTGGWQLVTTLLGLGHFLFPFLILLFRETKRRKEIVWKIAAFILVMRFVDIFWQVAGGFHGGNLSFHLLDLSTLALLGGVWLYVFLGNLSSRPLLPLHDARESDSPIYGV